MKLLVSFLVVCSSLVVFAAADIRPLERGISHLRQTIQSNKANYSESDVSRIEKIISSAIDAAESTSNVDDYLKCRQSGYSHDACNGQDAQYVSCRQSGYSHDACNGQDAQYVKCRQSGYSHDACNGQDAQYVSCRQSGYSHDACNGQSAGYVRCRQAGYSHDACNGK